jgi:TonB family protein
MLVRTSGGSVALHPISTSSVARPATTREAESRAASASSNRESENAPNLELGRSVRTPLPNINLPAGDSIARVAEQKVGADSFSKQFWTSGLDKKGAGELNSPRNAKLIGDMPQPFYPDFLRKNGIEGEVVVQFMVDQTGRPDVSTLQVVRSPHDALTASVRKAVDRMRFEPALTGGSSPTPRTEVVQISFAFRTSAK